MSFIYQVEKRSTVDAHWRVSLGCFSQLPMALASAYNLAPHDAGIVYREHGHYIQDSCLRPVKPGQDEIYLVVELPLHSEALLPRPHQEDKEMADADEEPDEEGDYSQWYDRNPGDQYPDDAPDNYPEAVDPEDFAPYEEDDDFHEPISWLKSIDPEYSQFEEF